MIDGGQKLTFILNFQFRENGRWQGTIQWIGKEVRMQFKSALELIKIIDSTRQQDYEIEMEDLVE